MSPVLYTSGTPTRSQSSIMLKELGLPYAPIETGRDEQSNPRSEHRADNKIPALVDAAADRARSAQAA